jgi:serine phosphatase RsbU (regulator of sigma subunit)
MMIRTGSAGSPLNDEIRKMNFIPVKKRFLLILFLPQVLSSPLFATGIDLVREPVYVCRDFDPSSVDRIPRPGEKNCIVIPGSGTGSRKIVLKELPLAGMPHRDAFSLEKHPAENFTFSTGFSLDGKGLAGSFLKGVYFANIGENWSVYLNGHLLREEIHLDGNGRITDYRHHREVLIPIDPRFFREGNNILTVRIVGDPTNIDSGFHRSTPFIIDDLDRLSALKSEQTELILVFIYLFVGLYHLFLFLRRTSEKYNFYYSAFSVMLFIYLVSRTSAVYAVIPDSTILHRIEYCSLYTLIPLFGAFADLLIAGRYSAITKIFAMLYSALILVTVLPVSNPLAIDVLRIWQVSSIVPFIFVVFYRIGWPAVANIGRLFSDYRGKQFIVRAARSVYGALFFSIPGNMLAGALIMFGCAVFDILDSMFWAYDLVMAQYGFFVFTIGITLILADRFISIHKTLELNCEVSRIEMELASDIHSHLLPPAPAGIEGWDIALAFKPRHGASGDFYDFYIGRGRLEGMAIFDVSGHGVSSALITMIVKPIIYRLFTAMRHRGLDEIIRQLDDHVSREIVHLDNYASCILLRFGDERIEYANAAHPDLLHLRAKSGTVEIAGGEEGEFRFRPIGQHISQKEPAIINLTVERGDVLLLFTDCIIESANTRRGMYGMSRLRKVLSEARGMTAQEVLDHIMHDFHAFMAGEQLIDDFTVICLKKTGDGSVS